MRVRLGSQRGLISSFRQISGFDLVRIQALVLLVWPSGEGNLLITDRRSDRNRQRASDTSQSVSLDFQTSFYYNYKVNKQNNDSDY